MIRFFFGPAPSLCVAMEEALPAKIGHGTAGSDILFDCIVDVLYTIRNFLVLCRTPVEPHSKYVKVETSDDPIMKLRANWYLVRSVAPKLTANRSFTGALPSMACDLR